MVMAKLWAPREPCDDTCMYLIHLPLVTHTCANELIHHWFRHSTRPSSESTEPMMCYYQLPWEPTSVKSKYNHFIHENAFEIVQIVDFFQPV